MSEGESEEQRRFQIELEFVQCLANPWYLNRKALQQLHSPVIRIYSLTPFQI